MDAVLRSFEYNLAYLRDQVADVADADMVRQPSGLKNHPAWVIGHLTYSCQAIGGEVGLAPWLPVEMGSQFGTGSVPVEDQSQYATKHALLESLYDAQHRIKASVLKLDNSELDRPLPDENFRALLPTIRHALTQILVAHTANHIGQITIWRNLMGMTPISRPFL